MSTTDSDTGNEACPNPNNIDTIRIATWSSVSSNAIQPFVDAYNSNSDESNVNINGTLAKIELVLFQSLAILEQELVLQQRNRQINYDGYIVPPSFLGTLLEQRALQDLEVIETTETSPSSSTTVTTTSTSTTTTTTTNVGASPSSSDIVSASMNSLLPYYKQNVAYYDQSLRAVPLLSGSQLFLWYRKDLFQQQQGIDHPPRTWEEYVQYAKLLHTETRSGSCLGRTTQTNCVGADCKQSLSSSYIGMMLSSLTQTDGTASGWWLRTSSSSPSAAFDDIISIIPLEQTLPQVLTWLQETLQYGHPDELTSDASQLNMNAMRDGTCAMTISTEYAQDMLEDDRFDVAPLPGSQFVLSDNTLQPCTAQSCPNGIDYETFRANHAPFAAINAPAVGAISKQTNPQHKQQLLDFYQFMSTTTTTTTTTQDDSVVSNDPAPTIALTEQPLYQFELDVISSIHPSYATVVDSATKDPNLASSVRIPKGFDMWRVMDDTVYDYLVANNFTEPAQQHVASNVERAWQRIIYAHDNSPQTPVPLAVFHEKSLGRFQPQSGNRATIDSVLRSTGWALGFITLLVSVYLASWVRQNRRERVVLASQPYFLYMVCAGTFVMGCSIFSFGFDSDTVDQHGADIGCMASIWLSSLGFVIAFSALFSKTWRINQIFRSSQSFQRIKVEINDVLLPFIFILGVNMSILLLWTLMDPLRFEWIAEDAANLREYDDLPHDDELMLIEPDTVGQCVSDHAIVYISVLLVVNLVFAFIALIQAYECRRITTEYKESLWIAGTLITIVQVWAVGVPVYGIVRGNPNAKFVVIVSIIFVTNMATLLLIFLPKMQHLSKDQHERELTDDEALLGVGVRRSLPGQAFIPHKGLHRASSTRRGLRLFTSYGKHNNEVIQLKNDLGRTVTLNRTLNERLGLLKDKYREHKLRAAKSKIARSGKVVVVT